MLMQEIPPEVITANKIADRIRSRRNEDVLKTEFTTEINDMFSEKLAEGLDIDLGEKGGPLGSEDFDIIEEILAQRRRALGCWH